MLVIVAGCGFAVPSAATADADGDGPRADTMAETTIDALPLGPFTNIVPLTALDSTGSEDDPTLTGDMLEIYFDHGGDIWFSVRASASAPWPAPQPLAVVNSTSTETTSEITADGLELYFSSNRPGGSGGTEIYVSTRADRGAAFAAPVRVVELESAVEDVTPTSVGDGLVMYLSSTRAGGLGGYDLWRATRPTRTSPWTTPALVTSLASPGTETEPWIDPTETTIYFSGDGAGGRDLWISSRANASSAWGARVPVAELNSAGAEEDPWLSPDGHTMIFASSRTGDYDLYMASR
jgi:hypothetical protein